QPFNVVEGAALGEKDVDDKVHIVEENPFAVAAALDGVGVDAELLFELVLDFVGDGYGLAVVGGGGNEEKVREAGINGVELEDAGILAFFVFTDLSSGLNENADLLAFCCSRHSVRRFSNLNRRPWQWERQINYRGYGNECNQGRHGAGARVRPGEIQKPRGVDRESNPEAGRR